MMVNVTGELKSTASTRPVSQEHLGCVRQSCCMHSRTPSGNGIRRIQEIHTVVFSSDAPEIVENEHVDPEQVAEKEQATLSTQAALCEAAAVEDQQNIAEEALEHQVED